LAQVELLKCLKGYHNLHLGGEDVAIQLGIAERLAAAALLDFSSVREAVDAKKNKQKEGDGKNE
jgi:hypothetical protein